MASLWLGWGPLQDKAQMLAQDYVATESNTLSVNVLAANSTSATFHAFTTGARHAMWTRSVLLITGTAGGLLLVRELEGSDLQRVLAFAVAFGAMHVPAAGVLMLKKLRHERPS